MAAYLLKRMLLMIPTMLGIMVISFVIIQFAPGGPVEQIIAQLTGQRRLGHRALGGGGGDTLGGGHQTSRAGAGDSVSRNIAARRASTRNSSRAREAVRLRQAGATSASA